MLSKKVAATLLLVVIISFIIPFLGSTAHAATDIPTDQEQPSIIEKSLSAIFRGLFNGISFLIEAGNASIDNLVYGKDETINVDFSQPEKGSFLMVGIPFFHILRALVLPLFVSSLAWIGTRLMSSAVGQKADAKGLLLSYATAMLLLFMIPYILQLLSKLNNMLIGLFDPKNLVSGLGFIDTIKEQATKSQCLVDTIVYGMAIVLNLWLWITYIARALTMTILYMTSPLFIFAYSTGEKGRNIFQNWSKEMLANIFVQSIHAFILGFIAGIISGTAGGMKMGDVSTIVKLVSMWMLIPATDMLRGLLGLQEGSGMSKIMGVMALGSAMHLLNQLGGTVKGGVEDIVGGFKTGKAPVSNESKASSDVSNDTVKSAGGLGSISMSARANKVLGGIAKGTGKIIGGISTAGVMGAVMSPLGAQGALLGGSLGNMVGSAAGAGFGEMAASSAVTAGTGMAWGTGAIYDSLTGGEKDITGRLAGTAGNVVLNEDSKATAQLKRAAFAKQMVGAAFGAGVERWLTNRSLEKFNQKLNTLGKGDKVIQYADAFSSVYYRQKRNEETGAMETEVLGLGNGIKGLKAPMYRQWEVANTIGEFTPIEIPLDVEQQLAGNAASEADMLFDRGSNPKEWNSFYNQRLGSKRSAFIRSHESSRDSINSSWALASGWEQYTVDIPASVAQAAAFANPTVNHDYQRVPVNMIKELKNNTPNCFENASSGVALVYGDTDTVNFAFYDNNNRLGPIMTARASDFGDVLPTVSAGEAAITPICFDGDYGMYVDTKNYSIIPENQLIDVDTSSYIDTISAPLVADWGTVDNGDVIMARRKGDTISIKNVTTGVSVNEFSAKEQPFIDIEDGQVAYFTKDVSHDNEDILRMHVKRNETVGDIYNSNKLLMRNPSDQQKEYISKVYTAPKRVTGAVAYKMPSSIDEI